MANNTLDADMIADIMRLMNETKPTFNSLLFNAKHEPAIKEVLNVPTPMGYGMQNNNMFNAVPVYTSTRAPAEDWKIPMLSESVDVSPEVREAINKTLMGFGKRPVVYAFNEDWIRNILDEMFDKQLVGSFKVL